MNIGGFGDTPSDPYAEGKKMLDREQFEPRPSPEFQEFIEEAGTSAESTTAHELVAEAAMNGGEFPLDDDIPLWVRHLYEGRVDRAFYNIAETDGNDGARAHNAFVTIWGDDDDWDVTDNSGMYSG